jgi:hypothetical protein
LAGLLIHDAVADESMEFRELRIILFRPKWMPGEVIPTIGVVKWGGQGNQ